MRYLVRENFAKKVSYFSLLLFSLKYFISSHPAKPSICCRLTKYIKFYQFNSLNIYYHYLSLFLCSSQTLIVFKLELIFFHCVMCYYCRRSMHWISNEKNHWIDHFAIWTHSNANECVSIKAVKSMAFCIPRIGWIHFFW